MTDRVARRPSGARARGVYGADDLAVYTLGPELRGGLAAPEPLAGRVRFYDEDALAALARDAGLSGVAVTDDDGGKLLTAHA